MVTTVNEGRKELLREIKDLPSEKIRELLDFVYFLKAREVVDPAQMYFWTKKWQELEKKADMDKKKARLLVMGQ